MRRYVRPMIPVIILYLTLLLVGLSSESRWQPVAFIMFYIALGQALNMFLGMTGYVDFGYVAFLALGSYGMALAFSSFSSLGLWVILLGFVLAIIMSALLSLAVGAIALRLRGAYFAIATIGVNEGFRYLVEGVRLWGGSEGIIISSTMKDIFGSDLSNYISTFVADIMVFVIGFIAAFLTVYIINSRIGYALMAVREDEDAARVMGVFATKYKIMAFAMSAIFAGLIGASAWTLKLTYVFPEDVFNITYTVEAIAIVMLGGAGTLTGPIMGGLIYGFLRYYLSTVLPGFQLLVVAPLLVLIVTIFPEGVMGYVKRKVRNTRFEKYII